MSEARLTIELVAAVLSIAGVLWRVGQKVSRPFIEWAAEIRRSTDETLKQLGEVHSDLRRILADHEERLARLEASPPKSRPRSTNPSQ